MLNRAEIIGYLGRDPEARYTPDGTLTVTLNIATTEKWKDSTGAAQERTEWHRCIAWGKLAEVCQKYLTKGGLVYVDGRIETRKWTDKEGNDKYTTEIVADKLQLLGKGTGSASSEPAASPKKPPQKPADDDAVPGTTGDLVTDDIPFN
jgi:single-strand DNA-binding protein